MYSINYIALENNRLHKFKVNKINRCACTRLQKKRQIDVFDLLIKVRLFPLVLLQYWIYFYFLVYCWLSTIPLGENRRLITFLLQKLSFIQNRFIAIVVQQQLYSSVNLYRNSCWIQNRGGGGDSTMSIPDFKFQILDFLSLELKFQIAIVRGIPDSRGQDF